MVAPVEPRRSGRGWLQARAFGDQSGGDIAPQGDQELPSQGDGVDLADAAADLADALGEPLREGSAGLVAQTVPGELDQLPACYSTRIAARSTLLTIIVGS